MSITPLDVPQLRRRCDPDALDFDTTEDIADLEGIIGQERAVDAIRFGMRVAGEGYNVFALGPAGTGKLSAVRELLAREARERPAPEDWCYVNNFEQPYRPRCLRLTAGVGQALRADVDHMIDDLLSAVPAAFQRDDFQARKAELEEAFQERQHQALAQLREEAAKERVALLETPTGFAFAPMEANGQAMNPMQFQQLSEEAQGRIREIIERLQDKLQKIVRQFPAWFKEMREQLQALRREIAEFAVGNLVDALAARYAAHAAVVDHLAALRADVIENIDKFMESPQEMLAMRERDGHGQAFQPYRVNVLVDNAGAASAPVVFEDLPAYGNLIGRAEYRSHMGTLVTDFTLIKPGALHRANGGYLILDARQVLTHPFAWDALKRVLRSREIRIESLERTYGFLSTASLEPEPIPLDVKVVLLGERLLFYLLQAFDPDFRDLFKVAADFEDRVNRDEETNLLYARLFATVARREKLRPLDRGAVAALIEQCARLAEDTERMTADLRGINDLIREADHWAGEAGRERVAASDVHKAIDAQIYRASRVRERVYDAIRRGTVLIATEGDAVGQVNGLSVVSPGDFAFGQPSRITATTRLGEGEVIDIERETELGGALHSKGVLILSNFLASRYAHGHPLSMAASLVFEQSYGMIEGDSASLAELCALLSSLSGLPVAQRFAVTGSVNQLGQVQAIGGVNEKIEGFFDVCRARGLSGAQGCLVPASNVAHLMLREEVVAAAARGEFSVYAVATVDEAIELLTGVTAGVRGDGGLFPEGSVNARVEQRLIEFSAQRRAFARQAREGRDG
jgi:predicted ATP-dependent protease